MHLDSVLGEVGAAHPPIGARDEELEVALLALELLPAPWTSLSQDVVGTEPLPAEQKLVGTLTNVASLALDLEAMCLREGAAYDITSDGPVTIALPGGKELAWRVSASHTCSAPRAGRDSARWCRARGLSE